MGICNYTVCAFSPNFIEVLLWFLEIIILHSFYRRIESETPDQYYSLYQIQNSSVVSFFLKYVAFRFVPMFLLCLLNYKILSDFSEAGQVNIFVFNFILISIELLFTNLRAFKKYFGYNLAWGHLAVSIILISIPLITYYLFPKIEHLLPSTQSVIDGIWTAVIIFTLYSVVMYYGKATENLASYPKRQKLLEKISKYDFFIEEQSKIYNADPDLVRSIAIYESIQRPRILRVLEAIFVSLFKVPTSQGVMQFTSPSLISDTESITLAIRNNLKDSGYASNFEELKPFVLKYNPSQRYINEIDRIYTQINQKFELLQPRPLEQINVTLRIYGLVPVSWLQNEKKVLSNELSYKLIDANGIVLMAGTVLLELPDMQFMEDMNKIYFSHNLVVASEYIKTSGGEITLKFEGINTKTQFFSIPLSMPVVPDAGQNSEMIESNLLKKILQAIEEELG